MKSLVLSLFLGLFSLQASSTDLVLNVSVNFNMFKYHNYITTVMEKFRDGNLRYYDEIVSNCGEAVNYEWSIKKCINNELIQFLADIEDYTQEVSVEETEKVQKFNLEYKVPLGKLKSISKRDNALILFGEYGYCMTREFNNTTSVEVTHNAKASEQKNRPFWRNNNNTLGRHMNIFHPQRDKSSTTDRNTVTVTSVNDSASLGFVELMGRDDVTIYCDSNAWEVENIRERTIRGLEEDILYRSELSDNIRIEVK